MESLRSMLKELLRLFVDDGLLSSRHRGLGCTHVAVLRAAAAPLR